LTLEVLLVTTISVETAAAVGSGSVHNLGHVASSSAIVNLRLPQPSPFND